MKLLHLIPALAYVNADVSDVEGFLTKVQQMLGDDSFAKEFVEAFSQYGCHCKKFSATENVGGEPIDALDAACKDYFFGVTPEETFLQYLKNDPETAVLSADYYYGWVFNDDVCAGDADPIDMAHADIIDVIGKKHGSEFASNLSNHGCHCKKLAANFDKDNVGGAPVDYLDALCRDFFSARSCMKGIGGKCQDDDSKQYENNHADPCSSHAEGSCGSEICQNNEDFVNNVGNFVDNTFDSNSQCTALDSAPKSHCCGDYPNLFKYSEDEGICANGQFQAGAPQLPTQQPTLPPLVLNNGGMSLIGRRKRK